MGRHGATGFEQPRPMGDVRSPTGTAGYVPHNTARAGNTDKVTCEYRCRSALGRALRAKVCACKHGSYYCLQTAAAVVAHRSMLSQILC